MNTDTRNPGDTARKRLKPWRKLSFKMSVGVVAILGFILIPMGRLAIHKQRGDMLDQLNEYGIETAGFVAEVSIVPIRKFSIYQLENFAARLEKGRLITYCGIYDEKGNPLSHPPGKITPEEKGDTGEILVFTREITDEGETIGRVKIGVDPRPVVSRVEKASTYIEIAFCLELIIIALAVNFYIHRIFVSPFIRLGRVTEEIAVGIFTTSDQAGRKDEIGWLAGSINAMSRNLRESYRDLERKVAERTAGLEAANAKLGETVGTLAVKNRESSILNRYLEALQRCENRMDTVPVVMKTCERLLPGDRGCITGLDEARGNHVVHGKWGEGVLPEFGSRRDACLAVVNRRPHACFDPDGAPPCEHNRKLASPGICVPVIVQGDVMGALHVLTQGCDPEAFIARRKLVENLAQQLALFLNNLQLRHTLRRQSLRDPLTGLFNRRYMEETLNRESVRAKREKFSIGIIMLDVDHFKQFNDTHGHDSGDTLLKRLARVLRNGVRGEDVVCRYGGEEFILILPGADLDRTTARAEEIRRLVAVNMAMMLDDKEIRVTVSLGASVYDSEVDGIEEAVKAADRALYLAKEDGRNVVRSARV